MKKEKGQAIILLAFALMALAAFAGLAVDGGRTYTARRLTQNAADAAAVAGARMLAEYTKDCTPGNQGAANSAVVNAMVSMANINGFDAATMDVAMDAWYVNANDAQLGSIVSGGSVPNGATGVRVSLAMTETTTFLRLVGRPDYNVNGTSTAMVGPVVQLTGGGILPIGVWEGIVAELNPGDEFILFDDETYCRGLPCDFSGHHIPGSLHGWLNMRYIYNVDLWHQPLERTFVKTVGNSGCSYNADGTVDVPGTGLRGWANINCPYPYPIFAGARGALNGDYIHADPGMRASTLQEVEESYPLGSLVYAPIFDYVYVGADMESVFGNGGPKEPDIGWVTAAGGNNASYLHIIGFVGTRISEIDPTGGNKHITGAFEHAIIGEGVITPSSGYGSGVCSDMSVWSVQLWQ